VETGGEGGERCQAAGERRFESPTWDGSATRPVESRAHGTAFFSLLSPPPPPALNPRPTSSHGRPGHVTRSSALQPAEMAHLANFLLEQHKAYLSSVCSSSGVHTAPTPISTPNPGHVAPGQSFGGVASPPNQADYAGLIARRQAEWTSAWSTATRYLSFPKPDGPIELAESTFGARPRRTSEVTKAIQLLLREEDASKLSNGAKLVFLLSEQPRSKCLQVTDRVVYAGSSGAFPHLFLCSTCQFMGKCKQRIILQLLRLTKPLGS
jgi:hypothetical protein